MENSQKTKILYLITQGEFGGAQHYIYDLAKNLKEEYEISVAFSKSDKNKQFKDLLDEIHVKHYELKELRRDLDYKQDIKAVLEIRKLIKEIQPQILHLNSSKISILGSISSLGLKTKTVYTAHGWVFHEKINDSLKKKYLWAEKLSSVLKEKIICVSEFDRQSAINHKIAPKTKLSTIHNGIEDFELLEKTEAQEYLSSKMDDFSKILSADFIIGSIGYLYRNKGFDYLINAVRLLVEKGMNPLLIIIGKGPEKSELKNLIDQLKLHDNVFVCGEIKNASRYLCAFDIYASASTKEGLSYTIMEAMTAGLPIVTTDVGGNPELITHQKDGLVVEAENTKKLAEAIIYLRENQDLAIKYGQSAHEKAIKDFTTELMIQKTNYLYKSLLS